MSDLISRADAIEAVAGLVASEYVVKDGEHGFYTCASVAQNVLSALPSADAVQGEWEFVDNEIFAGEYFCSICGKRAEVDLYGEWILSNFCPSCGARMKGGDDE